MAVSRSLLDTQRETDNYIFFHKKESPFSQFYSSSFKVGRKRFNCAEQFYMFCKAKHFGDHETATQIMTESDPRKIKKLGRQVAGFNESEWTKEKYGVVVRGNTAKFSQNKRMKDFLFSTGYKELVEASPTDRVWGIGLAVMNRKADSRVNWRGENLLGKALVDVRDNHISWDDYPEYV